MRFRTKSFVAWIVIGLVSLLLILVTANAAVRRADNDKELQQLLLGYCRLPLEAQQQRVTKLRALRVDQYLRNNLLRYPHPTSIEAACILRDLQSPTSAASLAEFQVLLRNSIADLINRKQFEQAGGRSMLLRSLGLSDQPNDFLNASFAHCRLGDAEQAAEIAALGAVAFPSDAAIANNLGFFYLELLQFEAAEASLQTALRLAPNSAFALNNLGLLREQQRKYTEALALFEKAFSIDQAVPGLTIDIERLKTRLSLLQSDPDKAYSLPIPKDQYCRS